MSCYETEKTYSKPHLPIRYPIPVDWGYSPFGLLPYTSGVIPRRQNLYTVPFNPAMVQYERSTYAYGGNNGILLNEGVNSNCGKFKMRDAYLSCNN